MSPRGPAAARRPRRCSKRVALAGVLIVLLVGRRDLDRGPAGGRHAASSVVARRGPRADRRSPRSTRAEAGEPQTILLLGSDQPLRRQEARHQAALGHDDPRPPGPGQEGDRGHVGAARPQGRHPRATATDKINAAYTLGGPSLTSRRSSSCSRRPASRSRSTTSSTSTSAGFRARVNSIGCVYVDIDRRYFNDNSGGGENYAVIDVKPGYQKLCGQDALDYVRFRHEDNDLVRAARQQDFLRQVPTQVGVRKLLDYRRPQAAATIFGKLHATPTRACAEAGRVLRCSSSALFTGRQAGPRGPVPRIDENDDLATSRPPQDKLDRRVEEFLNAEASSKPRATSRSTEAERKAARSRKKRNAAASVPGPRGRRERGRGPGRSSASAARGSRSTSRSCAPGLALLRHGARASTRITRRATARSTAPTGWSSPRASIGEYYGDPGHDLARPADPRRPARDARRSTARKLRALLRRRPAAARRLADRSAPSTGSPTRCSQSLTHAPDARDRRVAAPPRPEVARCASGSLPHEHARARADRRHRHGLRRPGHRGRLRRARQRGLLRRHRRGQDRAPQATARSRSTSRASPTWSSATASRLHFSTDLARRAGERAAAVRRRRHAAHVLGRRRPLGRPRGRRRDARRPTATRWS